MKKYEFIKATSKSEYSHKKFTEKDKAEIRAFIMALAVKHGVNPYHSSQDE